MTEPVLPLLTPAWRVPAGVHVLQTRRGSSDAAIKSDTGPGACAGFAGFNLGLHVGDDPERVQANRAALAACLPAVPCWLNQVHGTEVVELSGEGTEGVPSVPEADAVFARKPGLVCAIMTADCLPVLITDTRGSIVGAAHAGWRGLAQGVLEQLVTRMCHSAGLPASSLMAWLGPAIGPTAFEVGPEVYETFMAKSPDNAGCFTCLRDPGNNGAVVTSDSKWLADLPGLAARVLEDVGVTDVTRSGWCTVVNRDKFYSYRRERTTGRMASLIWMDHESIVNA